MEGFFGMIWLVCSIGGTFLGALGLSLCPVTWFLSDRSGEVRLYPTIVEFFDFIFIGA
jgi:hypothetical protein